MRFVSYIKGQMLCGADGHSVARGRGRTFRGVFIQPPPSPRNGSRKPHTSLKFDGSPHTAEYGTWPPDRRSFTGNSYLQWLPTRVDPNVNLLANALVHHGCACRVCVDRGPDDATLRRQGSWRPEGSLRHNASKRRSLVINVAAGADPLAPSQAARSDRQPCRRSPTLASRRFWH